MFPTDCENSLLRESFEQELLKEAQTISLDESIEKVTAINNLLWFLSLPNFSQIMFYEIKNVLIKRGLVSEFLFCREIERLSKIQKYFMEERFEVDLQQHFDFDTIYAADPAIRIKEEMEKIENFLEMAGLTDETVKKSKMSCPELLDRAEGLREKIDSEHNRLKNALKNKKTWNEFRRTVTIPFFLVWCEIIQSVNGKVTLDIGLVQDRIRLDSVKRQENE